MRKRSCTTSARLATEIAIAPVCPLVPWDENSPQRPHGAKEPLWTPECNLNAISRAFSTSVDWIALADFEAAQSQVVSRAKKNPPNFFFTKMASSGYHVV